MEINSISDFFIFIIGVGIGVGVIKKEIKRHL